MLQSRSPFQTRAKNRSNSPSPSSRLGRLFPPYGRISIFSSLGSNLFLRPVELGSLDPHAMQNNRELTRDRNLGLAEPVALGEPYPPSLHGGPFWDARQQNPGRFKQITSSHGLAGLRDATCPIDLSGRTASTGQPDVSTYASRPRKPCPTCPRLIGRSNRDATCSNRKPSPSQASSGFFF